MTLPGSHLARPFLLAGALSAGACSILDPTDTGIFVSNRTGFSVFLSAWELQSSHLIDLNPSISTSSQSRLILQVHDEVILEVPPAEHELMVELVPDIMGKAYELKVPLAVNLSFGDSWAAAK